MSIIIKAAHFAHEAHKFQLRKYTNTPYILHSGRVAARVTLLPTATEAMIAAAWLHDVLEDCDIQDQTILDEFGYPVADLVVQLTNPSKQYKHLPRAERKEIDREYLAQVPEPAKQIKFCDRIDNLNEMVAADDKFKTLYIEESRLLAAVLLNQADPTLYEELLQACGKLAETMHDLPGN